MEQKNIAANSKPLLTPFSLEEWLNLPLEQIKAYIKATHQKPLTVFLSIDGTRRYYLKEKYRSSLVKNLDNDNSNPATRELANFDFKDYSQSITKPLMQVFDLLFSAGITNVLNIALLPSTFERPDNYLAKMLDETEHVFLHSAEFNALYQKHGLRLRLFGDYDITPKTERVRERLHNLATKCIKQDEKSLPAETNSPDTPGGLYLGFYGDSFTQEIALRSATFFSQTGKFPTDDELRASSFPEGLSDKIDILICAGWLKVGGIVPPLLDGGVTDVYNLSFLALDLDEITLKRILYDHLFLRNRASDDNADYTSLDIKHLYDYYTEHQGGLIGVGQLIGPGLWYALHPDNGWVEN